MTPTEELKITAQQDLTTSAAKSGKFNFLAEVTALEQTEAVIAGIEEARLEIRPNNFPTSNLQRKISELREILMQSPAQPERVKQAETRLRQELGLWRMMLAKRDDGFSAFDLRSFCENVEPPIDNEFFGALGKFYRNMPPTAPVLSKFDYVVTQYFSRKREKGRRALRFEADKLVAELRRLNHEWTDGASSATLYIPASTRESITALAELSAKAKAHKTLKSWLEDEFFNYTRTVKQQLIETFFIPEVTAAVVVCNLVVGNHFVALCEADNDKLTKTAVAFAADEFAQQAVTTQLSQAFQTLLHFSLEENSAESIAQQRLTHLINITFADNSSHPKPPAAASDPVLNETSSTQDETAPKSEPTPVETVNDDLVSHAEVSVSAGEATVNSEAADKVLESEFVTETPQAVDEFVELKGVSELEAVLATLTTHKPNVPLIKSCLQKSSSHEIRTLNLTVFLPELNDVIGRSDDKNLRRALSIIIRAQELTHFVEGGEGNLLDDLLDEINFLREEIQEVNQLLRISMRGLAGASGEKERGNFENLLYATNTLVETQLRLNTAVIRRQPKKEAISQTAPESVLKVEKIKVETPIFSSTTASSAPQRISRWVLAFAASVIMIAGGLFFVDFSDAKTPIASSDSKTVELRQLKSGSVLTGAKVNKQTLFAFIGKDWNALSIKEKKEQLRSMVEQGEQLGFRQVIVMNKEGQVVATAWKGEVNLSKT